MRTDVKFGLAVGTLFFAGIMIYVLFFTGGSGTKTGENHNSSANLTARNTNPGPAAPADKGNTSAPPAEGTHTAPPATSGPNIVTPSSPNTELSAKPSAGGAAHDPQVHNESPTGDQPSAGNTAGSPAPNPAPGPAIASANPRGGASDWRSLLENGAPDGAITRTLTPGSAEASDSGPEAKPVASDPVIAAPTTRPSTGMRQYTVKQGETLWSIAKSEYGNASYYSHIVRANPGLNPSRLKARTVINLPDKSDVIPPASAPVAVYSPTTRPVDGTHQYKVVSGDNLNIICKKLYGSTAKVKDLYELNKGLIGPNPNALKLNMVLKLPESPTATASTTDIPTPQ